MKLNESLMFETTGIKRRSFNGRPAIARVLLAYPPSEPVLREDRCMVPQRNTLMSPVMPPTDLMYLASIAEAEGCICRIEDYSSGHRTVEDLLQDIRMFRPDCLLINAATPTLDSDLQTCYLVKQSFPDIQIAVKGSYFLNDGVGTLQRHPYVDMIIRGEAEITFREFIQGKDRQKIAGIVWRNGNNAVRNPDRPFLSNLDALPFPARHLIDNSRYVRPDNGRVQGVIKVSRGCPHHCFFCLATPVSGRRVRMRSPGNIMEEIRGCIETYGMSEFLFWSDVFTHDRNWVKDLCSSILDSGLVFSWSANVRVNTVDRETALLMRKAGCRLVSVGVESGNQEILDRAGKGTTLSQIKETFCILKEAGLQTFAYYLVGVPWETRETVEDTIRFAIALDSDYANFFAATPFPGTKFYEYALENRLFEAGTIPDAGLFRDAYYVPTVTGHNLSRKEIASLRRKAIRRFYLRSSYVLKNIRRVRTWREALNYSKAALALMKSS